MPAFKDLTGQRFGRLVAIRSLGPPYWLCRCDCGSEVKVNRPGQGALSCGCLRSDRVSAASAARHARNRVGFVGQRFGRWTVLSHIDGKWWQCRCECGVERRVPYGNLRYGISRSCGCLKRELAAGHRMRHGHCAGGGSSRIYSVWLQMWMRCTNPKNLSYRNYGGRGISVCDRWSDFENFFADMGERPAPGMSIDRINNDGNYEPGNCRWATAQEQVMNRRVTKRKAA